GVMLLTEPGPVDLAEPVGVGRLQLTHATRRILRNSRRELVRAEHRGRLGYPRSGYRPGVLELRSLALLAALGGDQHHAVGGVRAVDGRRAGVAQYRDARDVVGVEEVERVAAEACYAGDREPVDHVQRLVAGAGGRWSAHPDRGPAARLV